MLLSVNVYAQDSSSATISSILQLPQGLSLQDQVYEDINKDGLKDLVFSVGNKDKSFERTLRIYYQQSNDLVFNTEPDDIVTLTNDVIAFACADIDQNPGDEIILFTANACYGYRIHGENKDRIFKIADCEFLWQIPGPHKVFSWQDAILDFNNDGRMDIVVPQSQGFKILFQKSSEFISTSLLEIPLEKISNNSNVSMSRNSSGFNFSSDFGSPSEVYNARQENKPLVDVHNSINVPVFRDCDGDQRYDIIIHSSKSLYVWEQEENEPYFTNRKINLNISQIDEEDKMNSSDNQYVLDLNGDNNFDYLLFKRDSASKKIYTQILIYLNKTNTKNDTIVFDEQGLPQQLIKVAGLPGRTKFNDINQDGYPDLSFMIFNPDLLDQVETLASKSLKLQYLSFFNDKKGLFSRNPDISHEFNVSLGEQNESGMEPIQFLVDFNNDGLLDVLVRDKNNHIGLRLLRRSKNSIQILDKDVWDMTIPEKARIVYEETNGDTKDVLIITSPDHILYVRFK